MAELNAHRKQANEVIRRTIARIRDGDRELMDVIASGSDPREIERALRELRDVLTSMLALRRSTSR